MNIMTLASRNVLLSSCLFGLSFTAFGQIPYFNEPTFLTNNGQIIDVGDKAAPKLFDLDNDGTPELYVGLEHPDSIKIISYGNFTGTAFSVAQPEVIAAYPKLSMVVNETAEPEFIDYDGDGDFDLLVAVFNNGLAWFENENNVFTFHSHLNANNLGPNNDISFLQIMGGGIQLQITDIDNDGIQDMISHSVVNGSLYHFKDLDNTTSSGIEWSYEGGIQGIMEGGHGFTFQDFDSDGDLDYIFAGSLMNPTVFIYVENTGTPEVYNYDDAYLQTYNSISVRNEDSTLYEISAEINTIDGYDVNNDGHPDLLMGTEDGRLILTENNVTPNIGVEEIEKSSLELEWDVQKQTLSWNSEEVYDVFLYNNLGQLVERFNDAYTSLELQGIGKGVYIAQLKKGNKVDVLQFVNP